MLLAAVAGITIMVTSGGKATPSPAPRPSATHQTTPATRASSTPATTASQILRNDGYTPIAYHRELMAAMPAEARRYIKDMAVGVAADSTHAEMVIVLTPRGVFFRSELIRALKDNPKPPFGNMHVTGKGNVITITGTIR